MKRVPLALAILLLALPAPGSGPCESPPDTEVPLYTNEDLLRLFGPPARAVGEAPPAAVSAELWERVQAFIEWEHALLDARAQQELERLRLLHERQRLEQERRRGVLLLPPLVGGHPLFLAHPFPGSGRRATPPAPAGFEPPGPRLRPTPPLRAFFNERPTIHARPPLRHRSQPSARPD